MLQVIQRHVALFAGIALITLICVQAAPLLISARGDMGPTLLNSTTPILAMLAFILCIAISAVVAGIVGKLTNTVVGLFVLGAGMFVLDGRSETVRTLAFSSAGSSPIGILMMLLVEVILLTAIVFGAVLIVFAVSGPLKDVEPEHPHQSPLPWFGAAAIKSASAGIAILLSVWVIGQSPMKGQMVAATFIGGTLAGLIGRLISPHVQPVLIFVSPMIFGALGYAFAMFTIKTPLDVAFVTGNLPAFAKISPLDYAVGTVMGVAFGLGWAKSFLHHDDQPAASAAV